jgi:hypothetical protein
VVVGEAGRAGRAVAAGERQVEVEIARFERAA